MSEEKKDDNVNCENTVPVKRGPGRPRKVYAEGVDVPAKRRPGRPRKTNINDMMEGDEAHELIDPLAEESIPGGEEKDVEFEIHAVTDLDMLKSMLKGMYDIQKLRMAMGNRICANFYYKLGFKPGEKIVAFKLEKEAGKILKQLESEYKKITDGIASLRRSNVMKFLSEKDGGLISSMVEYALIENYMILRVQESQLAKEIGLFIDRFPIWTEYLKDVKGCGPVMTAVLLCTVDIHKCRYASSLEKYAGVDVVLIQKDDGEIVGEGRSRRAHHLVDREYIDKDGNLATRRSITYNPFLKTKLMGVLAGSLFIHNPEYKEIYLGYYNRISNSPKHQDKKKGHLVNMAKRYMVKIFLHNLYAKWRALEGLEVVPPYAEAKLGLFHHGQPAFQEEVVVDHSKNPHIFKEISELGLSTRATNALKLANISLVGQLIAHSPDEMRTLKGFSEKSFQETLESLRLLGLHFNIKIKNFEELYLKHLEDSIQTDE